MTSPETDDRAARLRAAIRRKKAAARVRDTALPKRSVDRPARLGPWQRSLWVSYRLDPSSPAYNLASAFRVTGPLDVEELARRLGRLTANHRLLRTIFQADRDGALLVEMAPSPGVVERHEAAPGEAVAVATREARVPFDLETAPAIRLLLVEEHDGADRIVVLLLHHILADERTLAILWRELADEVAEDLSAAQYDDYLEWWSAQAAAEEKATNAALAFWRQRLDPTPDSLALPYERTGRHSEPSSGRWTHRTLDPGVGAAIRGLATRLGTTPFVVLAFAYRLLLHRHTGGRDLAIATPASQRNHPSTAQMVGYFLNPVAIREPIEEMRPVAESIERFGRGVREALTHGRLPFDTLLEALAPPREGDRQPFFQTMFVHQEVGPAPRLGEATLAPVTLDLGAAKFDLTLFATERDGRLEIAVEYRGDRFDEASMASLLDHYETLLRHLPEHRGRAVARVPMLSRDRLRRARDRASGAALEVAGSAFLPDQIWQKIGQRRGETAVVASGQPWSYGDLGRAAGAITRVLRQRGVGPGDRVALFLERSGWMIAGLVGTLWSGAAYVPLDPTYPEARNRAVLDDAEVAAVLTTESLRDRVPKGPTILAVDGIAADPPPAVETLPELEDHHPAYLLYTSGSTGRPKGVVVSHGNLRASNGARLAYYGTTPQRFLLLSSIAFDSSVAGLFGTLATGGALVLPTNDEVRDPARLTAFIERHAVTSLLCVPSLYAHMLVAAPDRLRGLRIAIVAGEACPPALVESHRRLLPDTRLFNEYGPTEATVWATVDELAGGNGGDVTVGRPIPGARVEVLDDLGRRTPVGIPGEGWIAGPTVARGYWRQPERTAERFVELAIDSEAPERLYRTGDRFVWTADRRLRFLGRVDEQIKVRGFRVEPGEIEGILLERPEVRASAVVLRSAGVLVAFLQTEADAESRPHDEMIVHWRRAVEARLPSHAVPARWVVLPELPHLPNGKVDRAGLRTLPLPDERSAPRPEVEDARQRALIELWSGLLGRTDIGPGDNFFQLGGHSLQVVEMANAIARDFDVELAPTDVFQHPTVEMLARRLAAAGGAETPPYAHLFPLQPGGHGAPFLFCVPHFFSAMVADRFRGERPVYGLRGVSLRPEGNRGQWPTMRDLGVELVSEIRRRFGDRRVVVAGYSFGATMAVEVVRQLESAGIEVERLVLIAPMPVDIARLGPLGAQLDFLRRPVATLSTAEIAQLFLRTNHPLTRRPYQRLWRRLAIDPSRRVRCALGDLAARAGRPRSSGVLHADVRLERFRLHSRYRPETVRTPTVILNAREPATDAAATWQPFFDGPFTVVETPDPHGDEASIEATKTLLLRELETLS